MKIIYWSDYACPYCYIGITNLKKAAEELGIDLNIKLKSFELDPDAPLTTTQSNLERFANKYNISQEEAFEKINSITNMAKEAGINMDYQNAHSSNTFNAHRLTKLAEEYNLDNQLSEELYKAYFEDHKELANPETLLEAAKKIGMDEKEVKNLLESNLLDREVHFDENVALENGIQAVPFFIIDQKIGVPGALPVEGFKEILKNFNES